MGLKLALILFSWNESLLSIMLFSSTGMNKWCRNNTRLYLCSIAKWKVLETCRQPCSDSSAQLCPSCKSWCVFWLVSNSWCAFPCWLVPKLSVSPSLIESAGLLMVLMLLSISRHWISFFWFLISQTVSKAFWWARVSFIKAWKIVMLFFGLFIFMHAQ